VKDEKKQMGMNLWEGKNLRAVKKFFVAVVGFILLIVGTAMIVLPGPALIVIPLGLAILATEFLWAGRVLKKLKKILEKGRAKNERTAGLQAPRHGRIRGRDAGQ
jgi:uncharacterized protein (TIGR02611 family)